MKEVIAIVKPFLAERVLEALKFASLEACTVREVKGYGRQKSYLDAYGDTEYALAFLPKVEIQLWVDDARVDEVVEAITAVARTGRMGDGKIFVLPAMAVEMVTATKSGESADYPDLVAVTITRGRCRWRTRCRCCRGGCRSHRPSASR
jgi:nitrogen regulatory protein PII